MCSPVLVLNLTNSILNVVLLKISKIQLSQIPMQATVRLPVIITSDLQKWLIDLKEPTAASGDFPPWLIVFSRPSYKIFFKRPHS